MKIRENQKNENYLYMIPIKIVKLEKIDQKIGDLRKKDVLSRIEGIKKIKFRLNDRARNGEFNDIK
jgi:hypothetical protein